MSVSKPECYNEKLRIICIAKYLQPYLSAAKVFGIEIIDRCHCNNINGEEFTPKLYIIYIRSIEILLGMKLIFMILRLFGISFFAIHKISDDSAFFVDFIFVAQSVFMSLQFRMLRWNHLSLCSDECVNLIEDKIFIIFQKWFPVYLISLFTLIILLISSCSFYLISVFDNFGPQAFLYYQTTVIWHMFAVGHICFPILIFGILLFCIAMRFHRLSHLLAECKNIPKTKLMLDNIIENHTILWEYIQQVNSKYEHYTSLIYVYYLYTTCFFAFGFLFSQLKLIIRYEFAMLSVLFCGGILFAAWGVGFLTSSMYGNFVSVNEFSSAEYSLKIKLKILVFMKRFKKMPMGISCSGFFYSKTDFLVKVCNGLYSVFSSLQNLYEVQRRRECNFILEKNITSVFQK